MQYPSIFSSVYLISSLYGQTLPILQASAENLAARAGVSAAKCVLRAHQLLPRYTPGGSCKDIVPAPLTATSVMALFFMVFSRPQQTPRTPVRRASVSTNRTGERRTFLTGPQIRLDLYRASLRATKPLIITRGMLMSTLCHLDWLMYRPSDLTRMYSAPRTTTTDLITL
ncbi:hypothetical protein Zmor_010255 [Zophobas morio]|uniref:Uncharacterized protein n=1 Tax=Zophobas morio TaxID=2755281 RepID=A0AA38MIP9_9CUCU|nr:hypothetical protein Zmor_010255 [Zophobas morio]